MPETSDFVITGMGMQCAVGRHALQACASVRAGVNRFAGWPLFPDPTDESGASVVASASPLELGDESWLRKAYPLLRPALDELLWNAELYEPATTVRIGGFLAAPGSGRQGITAQELDAFIARQRDNVWVSSHVGGVQIIPGDHTAGAAAIQQALLALQQNKFDVCVVAGMDSLLHTPYLTQLHDASRLKLSTTPAGIIPGEAAACIAIETRAHAQRRGAKPLAKLAAVAVDSEGAPLDLEKPCKGQALTRAIRQVLPAAQNGAAIHRVYTDVNGERWRFLEFAIVNSRISNLFARGWQLHHPVDCLGDIGAAWVPAALCLATHAYQRRCAGPGCILITAAADAGTRAALIVGPA